jgi:hypothetical protein
MIAEITLPPFPTTLMIIGFFLFLLGLAGQITIKEARVGLPEGRMRIVAALAGLAIIGISVWLFFAPGRGPTTANTQTPSPAPTSAPQHSNIPIERYKELKGNWMVIEKVDPKYGGWEIIWDYKATVLGAMLTMGGKKTKVNDPDSVNVKARELDADEKATVCVYTLTLQGLDAEGTSEERIGDGPVLKSTLKLHFDDNFSSFSGSLMSGGSDVSSLMGSRQ